MPFEMLFAVPFRLPKDSWWTTACSTLGPMELATVGSSDLERFSSGKRHNGTMHGNWPRCFVQVRMWRILQRPWWSGPQLHSPLGIYRWGRINDLSYLLHQVSSHFVCHICRIHLHFFAGPNRCMLQVMLSETNIDINAMMCWCKVWEQISSKISIYPHFLTLLVCRVLMRAIGSVCRMSYICPKSSGLKVFVQQFTKTLRSSKTQDSQTV